MKLRGYQEEAARAILDSVYGARGLTFSVEIARQGGKNELSAHLELLLMTLHMADGGSIVKCSPTFKPQTVISMQRLKDRLEELGFNGMYHSEMGYIICLGAARTVFLSADEKSNVVGHTADVLLEVDESQDVSKEKYSKDFRPMGSAANATTVHYGTTWDDSTLLEEVKQLNLELEQKDGIRRHFRYDWQAVAKQNPEYRAYVESERERLGEQHPLFRTQYALLPIVGGGRLLSREQIAGMTGSHPRQKGPGQKGESYVAGVDVAGEHETDKAALLSASAPGQDSTVITIARVEVPPQPQFRPAQPRLKVVEHYSWTGTPHSQLFQQMLNALRAWSPARVCVDATGIGQPTASFLREQLGSHRVIPFTFTQRSKSDMGFDLLSVVNSGRLRIYQQDGSKEHRELMHQLEKARADYRPNQTVNYYVDRSEGHDDFLMSLALTVQAARDYRPRPFRQAQRPE